ncbi:hypothetical protein B0H14DRAFT_2582339 [Mycena olivaceomarginata]|nr:hypothetical protein B0H14DRAFT_2582339 [Mycena olivaceomarginata]
MGEEWGSAPTARAQEMSDQKILAFDLAMRGGADHWHQMLAVSTAAYSGKLYSRNNQIRDNGTTQSTELHTVCKVLGGGYMRVGLWDYLPRSVDQAPLARASVWIPPPYGGVASVPGQLFRLLERDLGFGSDWLRVIHAVKPSLQMSASTRCPLSIGHKTVSALSALCKAWMGSLACATLAQLRAEISVLLMCIWPSFNGSPFPQCSREEVGDDAGKK